MCETGPKGFDPKPIIQVLDPDPVVYDQQLALWNWMANYYMCSEGEVMAAALPTQLKLSSETILMLNEEFGEDFSELDDQEYLVAEGLLLKKELKIEEVQDILDASHVYPVVKRLLEKKCASHGNHSRKNILPSGRILFTFILITTMKKHWPGC